MDEKNKKIIIVIPTWKRAHIIERLLSEEISLLDKFDICIYDSSPDDSTYEIVSKYKKTRSNIFFARIDESISSNEKYFDICSEVTFAEYDYLWIIQDHLVVSSNAGLYLIECLKSEADFYFLDMFSDEYVCTQENNLNEFAVKSAWMLTRFGTAVMKTGTFLKNVNWTKVKSKWLKGKTHNNSHVGFYFERLAEIPNVKVETISFKRDQFYDLLRFLPVAWDSELLRICLECWGRTIEKLPNIYDKIKIMQSQDALFVSSMKLLSMKSEHRYGIKEFQRFKDWVNKIYPKRYNEFMEIAYLSESEAERKYLGRVLDAITKAHDENQSIFIYGAGRHGAEFAAYLDSKKIAFDGFIVSDKTGNPDSILGYYVYEATTKTKNGGNLIIIAVAKNSIDSIKKIISESTDSPNDVLALEDVL